MLRPCLEASSQSFLSWQQLTSHPYISYYTPMSYFTAYLRCDVQLRYEYKYYRKLCFTPVTTISFHSNRHIPRVPQDFLSCLTSLNERLEETKRSADVTLTGTGLCWRLEALLSWMCQSLGNNWDGDFVNAHQFIHADVDRRTCCRGIVVLILVTLGWWTTQTTGTTRRSVKDFVHHVHCACSMERVVRQEKIQMFQRHSW